MIKEDFGYFNITDKAIIRNVCALIKSQKHKIFLKGLLNQKRIPVFFIDDLIYILNQYKDNKFANKLKLNLQKIQNNNTNVKISFSKCMKNLDEYQLESMKTVKNIFATSDNLKGIILADDPGLGKTATSICIAKSFLKDNNYKRVLVVAQISLLDQWKHNILKSFDIDVKVHSEDSDICITNFENIDSLNKTYDIIIVDECHYIHNIESEKFKNLHTIAASSKLTLLLTGTPVRETINDLLSLYSLIDKRLETYDMLLKIYSMFNKYKDILYNVFMNRMRIVTVRHTKKEVFDDVGKIYERYLNIPIDKKELRSNKLLVSQLDDTIAKEMSVLKNNIQLIKKSKYRNKAIELLQRDDIDEQDVINYFPAPKIAEAVKYVFGFNKATYRSKLSSKIWSKLLYDTLKLVFTKSLTPITALLNKYNKIIIITKSRTIIPYILKVLNREGFEGITIESSDNEKKRFDKVSEFKSNNKINFIIATYPMLEAGLNFQEAKAILLCDAPFRPHSYIQTIHRTQRKNNIKDDAFIYQLKISDDDILYHDDLILEKHMLEVEKIMKDLEN